MNKTQKNNMGVNLKHCIVVSSKPPSVFLLIFYSTVIDKIIFEIQTSIILNEKKILSNLFKLFHSFFLGGGGGIFHLSKKKKGLKEGLCPLPC